MRIIIIGIVFILGLIVKNAVMVGFAQADPLDEHTPQPVAVQGLHLTASSVNLSSFVMPILNTDKQAVKMTFRLVYPGMDDQAHEDFLSDRVNAVRGIAPPLGLTDAESKEKLSLSAKLIYYAFNSTKFGLSMKSAAVIPGDGASPSFEWPNRMPGGETRCPPGAINSVAVGAQHQFNAQWAVLANLALIKPESYQDLTQGALQEIVVPVLWDETTRYVLGVIYMPADQWSFSAKVTFDRPDISFSSKRDETAAGQNRLWLAAAVDYHIGSDLSFDLEYSRLSARQAGSPGESPSNNACPRQSTAGEEQKSLDAVSAMLTIQF